MYQKFLIKKLILGHFQSILPSLYPGKDAKKNFARFSDNFFILRATTFTFVKSFRDIIYELEFTGKKIILDF